MKTFALKKNFTPLWLVAFVLLLPTVISFTSSDPDLWIAWTICGGLAILLVTGIFISRVQINSSHLIIQADIYREKIKLEDIQSIRLINLKLEPNLQVAFRTFGTHLPTYTTGWFELSNSQEAFVYLTDETKVVHLTTKDYQLLLSFENPEGLIEALQLEAAKINLARGTQ